MSENVSGAGPAVLSAACPGGMARKFRVQVRDERTASKWSLAGVFRESWEAQAAAVRLVELGSPARVVECRSLPTAA